MHPARALGGQVILRGPGWYFRSVVWQKTPLFSLLLVVLAQAVITLIFRCWTSWTPITRFLKYNFSELFHFFFGGGALPLLGNGGTCLFSKPPGEVYCSFYQHHLLDLYIFELDLLRSDKMSNPIAPPSVKYPCQSSLLPRIHFVFLLACSWSFVWEVFL